MKTWILVFAIAIGLTAILVGAVSWTARPPDQNVDHPEFAGMQQSGSDAVPDAGLLESTPPAGDVAEDLPDEQDGDIEDMFGEEPE